jgi:DNA-binding protein
MVVWATVGAAINSAVTAANIARTAFMTSSRVAPN